MTAPVVDLRLHHDALKATITAFEDDLPAYDWDEVPGSPQNPDPAERAETLPPIYALVAVTRRYNGTEHERLPGLAGRSSWRASIRVVGRTIGEASWALAKIDGALDGARLVVGGRTSTTLQFYSGDSPEWGDERYSALAQYTYVM